MQMKVPRPRKTARPSANRLRLILPPRVFDHFSAEQPTKYSSQLPVCRFVSNCSYLRVSRARVTNYLPRRGYFMRLPRRIAVVGLEFLTLITRSADRQNWHLPFSLPKNPLLVLIFMERLFQTHGMFSYNFKKFKSKENKILIFHERKFQNFKISGNGENYK